ncbi:hydantoinase/oxoprolinase N-terminal domain-containing protein, partial [Segeticoccus rhizosphaerae]|uniref:hydantoinase/oxoprolinase N-terminal domain-containing protein n=1 Tax=Segeticoccus rhizosphaerae TaxID=1104777 RepID=UPI0019393656
MKKARLVLAQATAKGAQMAVTDADNGGWRFAIDRGGTFTDVVATTPEGRLVTDKLLSENPGFYSDAASEAVRRLMA